MRGINNREAVETCSPTRKRGVYYIKIRSRETAAGNNDVLPPFHGWCLLNCPPHAHAWG